ncbi:MULTISPECIES: DUF4097 family beta strand repeat-containing protein [Microbacterium]|uniref:DUF4097 family beta strand repeat-containing protein n=1 Tax=Microbacterium barkeri TaxID=33917 RepID=UPI0024AEEECE|nr:DUF4097 family beta strand repeat-containing protein [Microbacterium barkeri]MDI6943776.1 DUF4097 family beta strand repeat-containing protein [Microbacterium barkeri]
MTDEKWVIHPGETRIIDVEGVRRLKVGLIGGQVDIIGHDEPHARVEVHGVTVKDLRIELTGDELEIDHPQLRWDNFLEVFRNFGAAGPRAEISVAVPRAVALTLGVVSAGALVAGLEQPARLNTVSGDVLVDGLRGDLGANAVSGDVQVRDLEGAFSANTVSGDVAVSGAVSRVDVDTVSGTTFVDAVGQVERVSVNGVSGAVTLRLDKGYAANYVARSASGRVRIDGVAYASSGPVSYTDSVGELSSRFVDVRINTVAGDITVVRREDGSEPDAAAETDGEVQWPGQAAAGEGEAR